MSVKGTTLRSQDASYYTWKDETYHGLTTILEFLHTGPNYAGFTWAMQEAQRLYRAYQKGEKVWRSTGCEWTGQGYEWLYNEVSAESLLLDPAYLKNFPTAELSRCADRGTVVHDFAHDWATRFNDPDYFPLGADDVAHWVHNRIAEGDGNRAYKCDADETIAHTVALNEWLLEGHIEPLYSEKAAIHKELGYACTIDMICLVPGINGICVIDFKTRDQVGAKDALQLAAQINTTHWLEPETGEELEVSTLGGLTAFIALVGTDRVVLRELVKPDKAFDLFLPVLELYKTLKEDGWITQKGSISVANLFDTYTPAKEAVS